jgi:hypothetical protein
VSVVDLAYQSHLFTDCTDHLTLNFQHPDSVELLMNHVGLLQPDLQFSASSFPSHHDNHPSNNAPSLPPLLEGENSNTDTDTDGPIENKAEWLDEGHVPELAKRAPSSKMSETIAIEVSYI